MTAALQTKKPCRPERKRDRRERWLKTRNEHRTGQAAKKLRVEKHTVLLQEHQLQRAARLKKMTAAAAASAEGAN